MSVLHLAPRQLKLIEQKIVAADRKIVMPRQKPNRSVQDVATPLWLIRAVEARWGGHPMSFDLAALPSNAKAPFYFTPNDDALTRAWSKIPQLPRKSARLWLNPQYRKILPWVQKAALFGKTTFVKESGARLFVLIPAAVGSNWWAECVHDRAAIFFIRPRLVFEGHTNSYPKDLAILCYGGKPGYYLWDTRDAQKNIK